MNELGVVRTRKRRRMAVSAQFAGQLRRNRRGLLSTTALQATALILLSFPALAQPAPTARPMGGAVVAGSASIAQTTAQTTVAQSSQRAAIDWRSYDIGSQHTVQYQQPGASSITLNRVTGPDPSQIAGKIQANGQVVIVNGSGVVFYQGAQVDVQSLVVSSANIRNENFMAGKMVFDQPGRPDARISNAGTITVAQTGLAALVAPQVQNSGLIAARMGHVVLAGAEAHTVDLYGDGLMSVDVTREVRTTQSGATALVTNSGTIVADGGTILLTARAADGIMQNLVTSRGRLQANTADGKTGTVVVSAIGGSISIEGPIQADGKAPGAPGGTVQLTATDTVAVGAASRISANGRGGGGTIAIGTTPARTQAQGTSAGAGVPASSARAVTVASGARISADGRGRASGGAVALLSAQGTAMGGTITARGGAQGGDGGRVEVSSAKSIGISGTVDTTAPKGQRGTLLLDPATLIISDGVTPDDPASAGTITGSNPGTLDNSTVPGAQTINSTTFNTLAASNNMVLTATDSILLGGGTALTGAYGISLSTSAASSSITIDVPLSASGFLTLAAGGTSSALNINSAITGNGVSLSGATVTVAPAVAINAGAAKVVAISTDSLNFGLGSSIAAAGGTVSIAPYTGNTALTIEAVKGTTAGLSLTPADIAILSPSGAGALALLVLGSTDAAPSATNATAGAINLKTSVTANAGALALYTSGDVTQTTGTALTVGTLQGAVGGQTDLSASATNPNVIGTLGPYTSTGGNFLLDDTGSTTGLNIAGALNAGTHTVGLQASTLTEGAAGTITADTLTGTVTGVTNLNNAGNAIGNLGGYNSTGAFTLDNSGLSTALNLSGALNAGTTNTVTLTTNGLTEGASGTIAAGTLTGTITGAATLDNAGNAIRNLGAFTATGGLTLNDAGSGVNGLNLSGNVTASGQTINLTDTGNGVGALSQSAGIITAGTLTGNFGGNVTLLSANAIGSLGPFTSGGVFQLNDTGAASLTVGGAVSGSAVGFATNSLTVSSTITSSAATGKFVAITTDNLTLAAGGSVAAAGGTVALAPLTTTRALTIDATTQATSLSLTPADILVLAPAAGTPALLQLGSTNFTPTAANASAASIALNTSVTVNATTLGLYSRGAITQTAASVLTVNTLTGAAAGQTGLAGAANAISQLGPFTSTGTFALDDAGTASLAVIGAVTGSTVTLSNAAITASAALTSNAPTPLVAINANTLTFVTGAAVSAAGGSVAVAPLTGNTALTIEAVKGTTAGLSLTPADIAILAPAGTPPNALVLGSTNVAPSTGNATTNAIGIKTSVTVNAPALFLYSSGTITETSGSALTVATLSGAAGGATDLSAGGTSSNNITNLGGFSSTGAFSLDDNGHTAGLTITGALTATGQTVTLIATGLSEGTSGTIAAGTLAGTVTGTTLLDNSGNAVASIGTFTNTGGDFTLIDTGTLNVNGALNVGTHVATLQAGVLGEGASGVITAGTLTGGSTTGATTFGSTSNAIANLGAFTSAADFTLNDSGSATGLAITGAVTATGHTLSLTDTMSAATLTQNGSVIMAGTLTGNFGSAVTLTGAANKIDNLGPFTAGGAFALNDTGVTTLTVGGALSGSTVALTTNALIVSANVTSSAATGKSVAFSTDTLTLSAESIAAAGGTVAVAPLTTARALTIDATKQTASLSLTPSDILRLAPTVNPPAVLQLGSIAAVPTAANATASSIALNTPVTVNATTLGLYATGGVSQVTGAVLTVNTLTGLVGSGFDLSTAANAITNLGLVTVGASQVLSVRDQGSLTVSGALSAPGGAITLASDTGSLALNATVGTGAAGGSITLNAAAGVTQTAAITTSTVSGTVSGGDVLLTNASNTVATLGNFSAAGGTFSLRDSTDLSVPAASVVTARNVTLNVSGALTVNGDIGACAISSVSGGVVDLQATGLLTIAAGIVGGERSTILEGALGNTVSGGFVEAGRTGTPAYSGTITIQNGLTLTGGTVSADTVTVASGNLNQSGGTLAPGALNLTSGTYTYTGGALYSNGAVALSSSGIAANSTLSGGSFTITGTGNAASTFTSAGNVYASGTITFKVAGNFNQTQGTVAATGDVTIGGSTAGSPAAGVITQSAGATLASGGTLLLNATGTAPVSLLGTLAGTTVNVDEPNAAVTFGPSSLAGAATVTAAGFTAQYHCPGCDLGTPSVTPGTPSVSYSNVPTGTLDVYGSSVSLTTPFTAGTVYLNGTTGITQSSTAAITATTALTGASASGSAVLTTAQNAVSGLGAFSTATGFALDDTGATALTVSGPVSATTGTVFLQVPSLTVSGTLSAPRVELLADSLSATGSNRIANASVIAIAPNTAATPLTVGTAASGAVISAASLQNLLPTSSTATLQLGTIDLMPVAATARASGIQFNQAVNLAGKIGTLALYTPGNVTETGSGGITLTPSTGVLTGVASGTFLLGLTNSFPNIDAVSGTTVTLASTTATTTTGAITAGAGTVTLSDAATITIGSIVGGGANTGAVVLNAGSGISEQTAGGVQTALLTGTASTGNAALNSANNLVATLGGFTAPGGTLTLIDGQSLAVGRAGQSDTIAAANVALSTTPALSSIDVNGQVGASGGQATLTAPGTVTVESGAVVGAASGAALSATGGVTVLGVVDAPTATFNNANPAGTLSLPSGGLVFGDTVNIGGSATITGGTLHATTDLTGALSFSTGDVYSGNDLSITLATATPSGRVGTARSLTVAAPSDITGSTVSLYSGLATAITASAGFHQTGGTIAAGTNLTLTAANLVNQDAGAALEATGTLLLRGSGGGTASILGSLAGGTIQVVEPAAALVFNPAVFTVGDTHPLRGHATIALGTLNNSYKVPGVVGTGAGTSTITETATPSAFRPGALRLDGATIALTAAGSTSVIAADTVELHSAGSTTQPGGSLEASSLSGTAGYAGTTDPLPVYAIGAAQTRAAPGDAGYTPGTAGTGTVTLDRVANNIAAITGYQVRGDDTTRAGLLLVDAPAAQTNAAGTVVTPAGLTLTGIVRAGSSTDPLDAGAENHSGNAITLTTTGTLAANGTLAGNVVTLNGGATVTETGTIVASILTTDVGSVAGAALTGANQIATLGPFTATTGNISLTNSRDLTVSGPVAAAQGTITITAQSGAGTASVAEGASTGDLTIIAPPSGTATLTARNVTLNGTDILVAGGLIGACLNGVDTTTGNVLLTATGGAGTITVTSGQIGGQTSVGLVAPGGVVIGGLSVNAPGLVDGPAVTVGTNITPTNLTINAFGTVFANSLVVRGTTTVNGGVLQANSFTSNGTVTDNGGNLFTNSPLTITTAPALTGTIVAGGPLTINGTSITSSAAIYAGGNTAINATSGDFHQISGTIAANGTLTITASGLVIQDAGPAGTPSQLDSASTLLLRASGAGAATVAGVLSGAAVQVIEPAATLTVAPATLASAATVAVGTLTNVFHCPGCDGNVPSSTVSTSTSTIGATVPGTLRLDGGTLLLGTLAATSVELHSLGATSQLGGASLAAATLTGTAGYAGTAATLPVYAIPAAQTRTAGGYTVASAVNGATVTLDGAGNSIAAITGYQVRGDDATRAGFTLVDNASLLLTGTLHAGPSSDPLDASAAAATGNAVSITLTGAGSSLSIGNGGTPGALVVGSTVALVAPGTIAEADTTASIVAGTLTGRAGTGVTLGTATTGAAGQQGNQIATLADFNAGSGAFRLQDSRSLTVTGQVQAVGPVTVLAQNGAGTPSAAEGASAGNLTLAGAVASSGGDATLEAYGTLSGGSVSGATVTLLAGGDVAVTGIGATTLTGTAGGNFSGSGTFGTANSTVAAGGALTLTDAGSLSLTGNSRAGTAATITGASIASSGLLVAPGAVNLRVAAVSGGNFGQTAGTIGAGTSLAVTGATATTPLSGTLSQTGGVMAAGTSLLLFSTGDATQGAAGTIAARSVTAVSTAGANTFAASQGATVTVAPVGVNLGGVLPVFTVPNPAGTVTLSGRPATERLDGATIAIPRLLAADSVELHAAGNLAEAPGGTIQALTLTGTAGYAASGTDIAGLPTYLVLNGALPGAGTATLDAATNNILRLGDFQARSGLVLVDAPAAQVNANAATVAATGLTIAGTVRAGLATDPDTGAAALATGAPLSISLTGSNATLAIGDAAAPSASLTGSTVNLVTPGAITEAAGALIAAGTLTGRASTATLTPTAGNQVLNLGAFTTTGNFVLGDATDLTVTGAVLAGPATPTSATPVLSIASRNLDLNGGSLTAGTVLLSQTGAITESNGFIVANTLNVTGSQFTGQSSQNAVAIVSGATTPGGFTLTDGQSLTTTGPITASGGPITLAVTGDLTTVAALAAGQAVNLNASGQITDAATSTISGPSVTTRSGGQTTLSGTVTATAGDVTVNANGLQIGGNVSGGGITLLAGSGAFNALAGSQITGSTLAATSALDTNLAGTVSTSGAVTVASNGMTVAGSLGAGGMVDLNAGGGTFTETGSISGAAITFTSAGLATLAGSTNTPGTLGVTAGGILVSGTVSAGPVTLASSDVLTESPTGKITATTLTATSAGATNLAGSLSIGGDATLTASGLTISGTLASATGAITLDAGAGTLSQSGSLSAQTVALKSGGVTTLAGSVAAQGLLSVAANGIAVTGRLTGNPIVLAAGVGPLAESATGAIAGSSVVITSGGLTTLAGSVTTPSGLSILAAGPVATPNGLTVSANGITIGGALNVGPLTLGAGAGALVQNAGSVINASSVSMTGTGPVTLAGTVATAGQLQITSNGIEVDGSVTAGPIVFTAGTGPVLVAVGGSVVGSSFSAVTGGPSSIAGQVVASGLVGLQANGIGISGRVVSNGASVGLNAGGGDLTQLGTVAAATTLTGLAGGSIIDTGAMSAGTTLNLRAGNSLALGGSSVTQAGTSVTLTALAGNASLAGRITTPLLLVTAPAIQLRGGTISVGGTVQNGAPTSADRLPTAATATAGAFFEADSAFSQTGVTGIASLPGSPQSTVRVDLTSGAGTATFQEFDARTTNLILNVGLGTASGGPLTVNNLTITYSGLVFNGGSADLFGQVGDQFGTAAAGIATILPQSSRDFRLNSCAIGSVNCIILSPTAVPVGNPLKELSLNFFREQDDDNDLLVPNISDQGL